MLPKGENGVPFCKTCFCRSREAPAPDTSAGNKLRQVNLSEAVMNKFLFVLLAAILHPILFFLRDHK